MGTASFKRTVSRWQIVGLALNDVIGSGIYLLPAAATALLGPMSLWAVVLAGISVLLVVLCFAEAGSYFDQPGSAYLYAGTAFGPLAGFSVGWMTWLTRVASQASLAVGFAQALTYLWPAAEAGWVRTVAIVLPVLALTAINYVGVESGVRTAVFLVITKAIPLLLFVAAGIFAFSGDLMRSQVATEAGPGSLGQAALLLLFAYAGFENTAAAAGEYKNPRRDVPFALITQIVLVTVLYAGVQWVALGTLPNLAGSATPLADAANGFLGSWAGTLLTVGAVLSILGTNGNTVFAGPRYLYALAADGYGPRALGKIHPRFQTPANALLFHTALTLPLALSGSFVGLAALSVVARLATYLGTIAAVPVLRRRFSELTGTVRLPGGPTIPILAGLVTLGLATSAERKHLIAAAVALVVGLVVYYFRRRTLH